MAKTQTIKEQVKKIIKDNLTPYKDHNIKLMQAAFVDANIICSNDKLFTLIDEVVEENAKDTPIEEVAIASNPYALYDEEDGIYRKKKGK